MLSDKEIFNTAIKDPIVGQHLELALRSDITVWRYFDQNGRNWDRLTVAIHEVGHAVVSRYFGMPVYQARVFEQDDPETIAANGIVHYSPPKEDWYKTFNEREREMLSTQVPLSTTETISIRMATIYCAGWVAELINNDVDPGKSTLVSVPDISDWNKALHFAGLHKTNAVLLACQLTAYEILKLSWNEVIALADELAAKGSISQEDIDLALSGCALSRHRAEREQKYTSQHQAGLH